MNRRLVSALTASALFSLIPVQLAWADGAGCNFFVCGAKATSSSHPSDKQRQQHRRSTSFTTQRERPNGSDESARGASHVSRSSHRHSPHRLTRRQRADLVTANNKRYKAVRIANANSVNTYHKKLATWQRQCLTNCGTRPKQPTLQKGPAQQAAFLVAATATAGPPTANRAGNAAPPIPTVSPVDAAHVAVAHLRFPSTTPGIGPSPDINPWKMAVVGYPLWLWADGPTHVGPVADTVAGLSVSLDAHVATTVFAMGDGHTVTCQGTGTPWSSAVQPGQKSSSCGHTYTDPSLPTDSYTVTATVVWRVRWTVNNTTGVITVPRTSTTRLPVGELQVLNR